MKYASFRWYTEHRLEYLRNRLAELRPILDVDPATAEDFPFALLEEFLEIKGRIKEIESILEHAKSW